MRIICVVPARLHSRRLPRKVLRSLGGKPILQWIFERGIAASLFDRIMFAVDHPVTAQLVRSFGGEVVMTRSDHLSGTDRLLELYLTGKYRADLWINWQADEPLLPVSSLATLIETAASHKREAQIFSLRKKGLTGADLDDPSVVKVVCDQHRKALYFSRYPIPYRRQNDPSSPSPYFKHIGLYGFTPKGLDQLKGLAPSPLERSEQLEQLRFLEHGLSIQLGEAEQDSIGIDTREDLAAAERESLTLHRSLT